MERTTISIPPELHARLRRLAFERKISMAALIREALEQKAKETRPPLTLAGIGASKAGSGPTAREAGDVKFEPRSWR